MPLTPEQVIAEQIEHLRRLTRSYAQQAMAGTKAELELFITAQNQLAQLLPYQAGYETPAGAIEAPAPLFAPPTPNGYPAPPLRSYDEEGGEGADAQRTAVSFPPDPLFGPEPPAQEESDGFAY
jgi:hypothetical protein